MKMCAPSEGPRSGRLILREVESHTTTEPHRWPAVYLLLVGSIAFLLTPTIRCRCAASAHLEAATDTIFWFVVTCISLRTVCGVWRGTSAAVWTLWTIMAMLLPAIPILVMVAH